MSAMTFAQGVTPSSAYMGGGYSIYDSSVIPNKRMGQQNEFWNHATAFPSKPRNMWEVGVSTGIFTVSGDVSPTVFTAPNFSAHVRKSFGYVFSLRLQYINTVAKGMNWKGAENFQKNPAWVYNGYNAPYRLPAGPLTTISSTPTTTGTPGSAVFGRPQDIVYYNYKTNVQDLGLQGIFTVNNIRFHKNKTGIIIYGGGGIGGTLYESKVNVKNDATGATYAAAFKTIYNNYLTKGDLYKNRKAVLKDLRAAMDNTYETSADGHIFNTTVNNVAGVRPSSGNKTFKPSGTVLAGIAFKLGRRINLAIEDRWTFVKDDLLDGQRWQEHAYGDAVLTRDFDSYNYASIGLNFNLGGKSTEPLYWLNPMDYVYSELNAPNHLKVPKPDCDDTDGDGVCDFLDKEVTPAGCPVDTHGVTRDTDGDGVPDCKDKQLITPTECQPVDADGVGKCPEPKCCTEGGVVRPPVEGTCPASYPSLNFKGNGCSLSSDTKALLNKVAGMLKDNPTCNITISGVSATNKASQEVCNCRMKEISKYLTEKEGISSDRISTNCEVSETGSNTIDIK
jgi:hypothetical protein